MQYLSNDVYSQQRQQIQSLQTEIEGYKKSIQKEQENNETLTLMLQKNEIDINSLKKQIATSQAKQEQLKQEYSAYSRMLHETEQNLNRATTVCKPKSIVQLSFFYYVT